MITCNINVDVNKVGEEDERPEFGDGRMLMQIVHPDLKKKYCSEFTKACHFKPKIHFCLVMGLAPYLSLVDHTPHPNQAFWIRLCVFRQIYACAHTETDLGPDVLNPRLYKSSFLRFHVAVPVLTTAVDHTAVDTFQYISAAQPNNSGTTLG